MKERQYSTGGLSLSTDFISDIRVIEKLTIANIRKLAKQYVNCRINGFENDIDANVYEEQVSEILKSFFQGVDDPAKARRLLTFLVGEIESPKVRVDKEEFIESLLRVLPEDDDARKNLSVLIKSLWDGGRAELSRSVARQQSIGSSIQRWIGVSTLVDARAVIPNYHRFGEPLDTYEPVIAELTPVGIITLSFKRNEQSSVHFEVTPENLELLMVELSAMRKDFEALARCLARKR